MTRGMRGLVLAAACGALAGGPALARAQRDDPPATGAFTAQDDTPLPAWHANGGDATTLTIAAGGTVTFSYPAGKSGHNLVLDDPAACTGDSTDYRPAPWTA